ncbi:phage baseplate assembly protein domain-containing protein [Methylobacterium nodulans]|uniref:Mu-like prophage protein GP45-like protein n=1 Tax=Methylobacterium nodulans (strain LMG 21967 / CNCM I-2342 / ORS 2060) TaxID=460265 RepID=B8ICK5_METNO|nr:phage baseplate assembly protein [Methylobacterium nodulans]ACL57416.1 Mu-like prophage protein GP45-like protein [Methylobacterium nodulans ORS 2060]
MSGRLFRVEHVETDDKGDLQTTTLLGPAGEELKRVHRLQPFGFHSSVPKGAHGLGVQFGGGPEGGRRLNMVLGLEHPDHRPKNREVGSTALYDANGSIVSLVQQNIRVVHSKAVHIVAPEIVLEGTVYLGGKSGAKLVHRKDDLDSDGDIAVGSASKVYAV